jgi:hypothetical protein
MPNGVLLHDLVILGMLMFVKKKCTQILLKKLEKNFKLLNLGIPSIIRFQKNDNNLA